MPPALSHDGRSAENIIPNKPGVKPEYFDQTEPLGVWSLLLMELFKQLCHTNEKIAKVIAANPDRKEHLKEHSLSSDDFHKNESIFGTVVLARLLSQNHQNAGKLVREKYGHPVFS